MLLSIVTYITDDNLENRNCLHYRQSVVTWFSFYETLSFLYSNMYCDVNGEMYNVATIKTNNCQKDFIVIVLVSDQVFLDRFIETFMFLKYIFTIASKYQG